MALCPDCKREDEIVSREPDEPSGLAVTYECSECDERWVVGF